MTAAVLFVIVLLLIGVVLRLRFRLFQWLYVPASVIAGLLGLGVVQVISVVADANRTRWDSDSVTGLPAGWLAADQTIAGWVSTLGSWPGFLIAVVFAGMLLERKPEPVKDSLSQVGRQGLMVWIIVLGQTAVGLLATWLLIQPSFDVPNSIGMLIETGFAGGHGTAAAMGKVYSSDIVGLESGLDLGILMATSGLVYGIITGILWINLGVRFGWVHPTVTAKRHGLSTTEADAKDDTPIGFAKVGSETIDPLLLQIVWLALAVGLGMAMQAGVMTLAGKIDNRGKPPQDNAPAIVADDRGAIAVTNQAPQLDSGKETSATGGAGQGGPSKGDDQTELRQEADNGEAAAEAVLSSRLSASSVLDFPLFIYTLFGGLIVRKCLGFFGRANAVDRETINRLTSTAMDLLVVAAITSLNLAAVASLIVPFSILFVVGVIWCGICLLVLAKRILPSKYWFELGLINYGMSTGTTATGFVLLRVVDPEIESGAAEDYALAAPLSSPFIGGGMITVALPLLLLERVPIVIPALAISAIVGILIFIGIRWNRLVADRNNA